MSLNLYGLKSCDTTRKAMKWLEAHNIAFTFLDVRENPPSSEDLLHAMENGIASKRLWNISGGAYREGGFKDKAKTMSQEEIAQTIASNSMLLKRPFIATESAYLVGFVEDEYASALI
jgi:arsenate reductase